MSEKETPKIEKNRCMRLGCNNDTANDNVESMGYCYCEKHASEQLVQLLKGLKGA